MVYIVVVYGGHDDSLTHGTMMTTLNFSLFD